jgi:hypothetical protein
MISGIALALRLPDLELSYKVLPAVLIPIATYIGGVFTEPAKRWLANRTDRKRLRNALYSELAGNLNQSLIFLSTLNYPEQFPTMDLGCVLRCTRTPSPSKHCYFMNFLKGKRFL